MPAQSGGCKRPRELDRLVESHRCADRMLTPVDLVAERLDQRLLELALERVVLRRAGCSRPATG
jgi:hypothetical protein